MNPYQLSTKAAMRNRGVPEFLDERREWLRVDDQLLLDYRVVGESSEFMPAVAQGHGEVVTTFIRKPTADLLAQGAASEAETLLVPWLKKIDWLLEVILRQLGEKSGANIHLPTLTPVNIGGGGVSFAVSRLLTEGNEVELRLILPAFTTITARAVVTRVEPAAQGLSQVATRFVDMSPDDHEGLIRHILHRQADRLRARHRTEVGPR